MGVVRFVLVSGALGVAILAVLIGLAWQHEATPPEITTDGWWGAGERKAETKDDEKLVKYKINVSDAVLTDLKKRLQYARFKTDLEDNTFNYGFRSEYLKEIVAYWKDKYDWRKQEKILNSFDHFKTKIEGIDIHYIHAKPKSKTVKTVPLLMVHGWPGSVSEFYKIIPMLTDPKNDVVFEMICPSIPGFGFSEASHKPGFDPTDAARIFLTLMKRLGHEQFYAQGGDFGNTILMVLSQIYPQNVLGFHTNMPFSATTPRSMLKQLAGAVAPGLVYGSQQEVDKVFPYGERFMDTLQETGYLHIQATKPDTVGMGLNDSPIGLAAYLLEKFGYATNKTYRDLPDGGTAKKFTLDELLTNVMIYWTSGNVVSSLRLYKETFASEQVMTWMNCGVYVPVGVAAFPGEVVIPPRVIAVEAYRNMVQYTDMPRGGHFAALEEPRLLADDVISFVKKVQSFKDSKNKKQKK